MRRRVVLFDLDGTVVTFEGSAPGPGRSALELAMRELHGVEGTTHGLRVAGGTDRALARSMLVRAKLDDGDESIERLLAAYLVQLQGVLQKRRYWPVGEVAHAVAALRDRGAVVGVATGNVRAGARLKLESAGLLPVFDLALGGFGCDAEPRAEILRVAADRCAAVTAAAGHEADFVVVGDTEHDVRAARAIGARIVGVAITDAARAELEAAGADTIVSACGDALVSALFADEP